MWKSLAFVLCGVGFLSTQAHAHSHHIFRHNHRIVHHIRRVSSEHLAIKESSKALIEPVAEDKERTEVTCLALGIYREARGEPKIGRIAVGLAILNRIHQYGTVCKTLWAEHGTQFPWVRWPVSAIIPRDRKVWSEIQSMALDIYYRRPRDITYGATMFYNPHKCHCRLRGVVTAVYHGHTFVKPFRHAS